MQCLLDEERPLLTEQPPIGTVVYYGWGQDTCTKLLVIWHDVSDLKKPQMTEDTGFVLWMMEAHGWSVDMVDSWSWKNFHTHE